MTRERIFSTNSDGSTEQIESHYHEIQVPKDTRLTDDDEERTFSVDSSGLAEQIIPDGEEKRAQEDSKVASDRMSHRTRS